MLALLLAVGIVVADQWTKEWVRAAFVYGDMRPVVDGFFSLTYVRNTGAAWGMLGGHGLWLIALSIVMLVLLVGFRRSLLKDTVSHRIALGLLIGGIVGNLIDRLRFGYVVDFLHFYYRRFEWPSFNIADSAICVGVGIYLLTSFREEWRARRAAPAPESPAA